MPELLFRIPKIAFFTFAVILTLSIQSAALTASEEEPRQQLSQNLSVFLPFLANSSAPIWPNLSLTPLAGAENVNQPIQVAHAGDGSGRLFIVERPGTIQIIANGQMLDTPFLDISDQVTTSGECGLLSVAFPANFASEGYFFVYYNHANELVGPTERECDTVVARFRVSDSDNRADPSSEERILILDQPFRNHNGGQITFGPDGYLYIGMGDGGSANDPDGNAQNTQNLLGKMLRVEVGASGGYTIPISNPFTQVDGVRDEIWALGLRNPWRFSFDRDSGDMYIADVGQGSLEEINFQIAVSPGGENYGWDMMEGTACFEPAQDCVQTNLTLPVWEYDRSQGDRSISGGYVYRGSDFPRMRGIYFYGDYASGRVWGLQFHGDQWINQELLDTTHDIVGFGEDEAGNLYLVDVGGTVYRLGDLTATNR